MKKWISLCICAMAVWSCEDLRPPQNQPHTVEAEITGITETSAACSISIEPLGATRKAGIVYGTDSLLQTNLSEAGAANVSGNGAGVTLVGLNDATRYYIKAYAADKSDNRVYGSVRAFTTLKNITLSLSALSIEAAPTAGSCKLTVTSNDSWTIVSNQSWCTVQPASGTGDREITVAVAENATITGRTAVLTVTAGKTSKQVTVQQAGKNITLTTDVSLIEAGMPSGTYKLTVSCNDSWTIVSDQTWCSVYPSSGTGNGMITVTIAENTTIDDRTATLTVTAGNTSRQVSVQQKGEVLTEFGYGIAASENFGGGDGSQYSPYLITDARHLKKLVEDSRYNSYSGVCFRLATDIQVTAAEWIPIGSGYGFGGVFDGGGHAISGTLKSGNYSTFGFFGNLRGATVSNLTISAAVRNECASTEGNVYTGALAGDVGENSAILNCNVSGQVKGGRSVHSDDGRSSTGGVAGEIWGSEETPVTVSNCMVSESVTGGEATNLSYTGGIAGEAYNVEITSCTVFNLVTGVTGFGVNPTGGIVGRLGENNIVRGCNVSGPVRGGRSTGGDSHTGGIVGWIYGTGNTHVVISNCTVSGSITGGDAADETSTGGIVGSGDAEITNCTVSGSITGADATGHSYTGGIAGLAGSEIMDCTVSKSVTGGAGGIGGIVGYIGHTGGLAGFNSREIHTSLNTGNVTASSGYVGGLVGVNPGYVYSCCTNRGNVNGQPANDENQISLGNAVTPCPNGHAKR
ncbi:MAG: BACON domain-containing protein [Tannerella sp.]|jgi:hypothetical protein|nr:BACON domain-containing protein [Tannerella sp.]